LETNVNRLFRAWSLLERAKLPEDLKWFEPHVQQHVLQRLLAVWPLVF